MTIGSDQCEVWKVYLLFNICMFCILFVCVLVLDDTISRTGLMVLGGEKNCHKNRFYSSYKL